MFDEDVDQEDSGRPLALPWRQRSEQDDVGFDVVVVAFHEGGLDHASSLPRDAGCEVAGSDFRSEAARRSMVASSFSTAIAQCTVISSALPAAPPSFRHRGSRARVCRGNHPSRRPRASPPAEEPVCGASRVTPSRATPAPISAGVDHVCGEQLLDRDFGPFRIPNNSGEPGKDLSGGKKNASQCRIMLAGRHGRMIGRGCGDQEIRADRLPVPSSCRKAWQLADLVRNQR